MDLKEIVKSMDKDDIPDVMEMLEERASKQLKDHIKKTGVFKAKIKEGNIEVPEAEREAMELKDDELVQVFVKKLDR